MRVYIGLGSNLGNREDYLKKAIDALKEILKGVQESSVFETAPQYITDQPAFLNQVISGETDLPPLEFLSLCQAIQKQLGRSPSIVRFGPREIDIDILSFGTIVLQTEVLEIPHPRISERLFVLEPLLEIAPDWVCPKSGVSAKDMMKSLSVL